MRILVKQIGSGKGMDFIKIADAALDFAENVAEERLQKKGYEFVENWTNPPGFKSESTIEGNSLVVSCEPSGNADAVQHWKWVSRGTAGPYPIFPTAGRKTLKYRKDFTPKTAGMGPRVKTGMSGGKSGEMIYPSHVTHPGIKPRHFEEAWRSWANLWWGPGIRDAIAKATKNL